MHFSIHFIFIVFLLYIDILYCSLKPPFLGVCNEVSFVSVMYFVLPPHKILGCQYPYQCSYVRSILTIVPSLHSLRMDWRPKRLKSLGQCFKSCTESAFRFLLFFSLIFAEDEQRFFLIVSKASPQFSCNPLSARTPCIKPWSNGA